MARCTEAEEVRWSPPREAGFSLVELVVVVVIIGVLASLGVPRLRTATTRARAAVLVNDVRTVRQAAFDYFVDHNAWPPATEPGQVPEGLDGYLPDGFTFRTSGARLNFINLDADGSSEWGERVGLGVSVEDDAKLEEVLARLLATDRPPEQGGEAGLTVWVADEVSPSNGEEAQGPHERGLAGVGNGPAAQGGPGGPGSSGGSELSISSLLDGTGNRR